MSQIAKAGRGNSVRCFLAGIGLATALCGSALAAANYPPLTAPAAPSQAAPNESPWPLTLKSGAATLTVYAPQLDHWDGYQMTGRVAVGVSDGNANAPRTRFGIVTFRAATLVDKSARLVTLERGEIVAADFPSASNEEAAAWRQTIGTELARRSRRVALDRFEAQAAVGDVMAAAARAPLRHDAPRVLFATAPTMLVHVDGKPVFRNFGTTPYQRLINTRPLVLRDAAGALYLKLFDGWMTSASLDGAWSVVAAPAPGLDAAYKTAMEQRLVDPLTGQTSDDQPPPSLKQGAPRVVIVQSPTELVVTDGAPNYTPIAGTGLVYIDNTTANVFRDTRDNALYLLTAGRWFRATTEAGPWSYVAGNALPADFARIPDDSPKENVKASIPGTSQAREAAIAASVPHTAAVTVSDTNMDPPRYDGVPELRPIEGTQLEYVVNTPTAVIRVASDNLYALQNGVWFRSVSLQGPWAVALTVPADIYRIPPSSPLYYVTFVRIYGYGTGVVYVGYTAGYMGTYVDPVSGVAVYGTGYAYDPWLGLEWYGTPVTYGYGATIAYTPWTGWSYAYGFGWYCGPSVYAGWCWGPYPYWGYYWYPAWAFAWGAAWGAAGGAIAWGPGVWAGYTGNIYTQWGNRATVSRVAGGYNAWTGNAWATQVGKSYNSRTGVASAGQRSAVRNVYTGNFAAGGRGIATGPQGNVAVGRGGIVGNTGTGEAVAGGRGAVYNKETGEWTRVGGVAGSDGGKALRVGDDVYAGKDGNVYRRTEGGGWEQHTGSGWQPVQGSGQQPRPEPRRAEGAPARDTGALDRDYQARQLGADRAHNLRDTNAGLSRSYGGRTGSYGGGRAGGGFRGGGGRGGRR